MCLPVFTSRKARIEIPPPPSLFLAICLQLSPMLSSLSRSHGGTLRDLLLMRGFFSSSTATSIGNRRSLESEASAPSVGLSRGRTATRRFPVEVQGDLTSLLLLLTRHLAFVLIVSYRLRQQSSNTYLCHHVGAEIKLATKDDEFLLHTCWLSTWKVILPDVSTLRILIC